jgi:hypothetical protein
MKRIWRHFRFRQPTTDASLAFRCSDQALGDQMRSEGRWSEAAKFYRNHLTNHPSDFGIWVQLGHALKEAGALVEAEEAYRQASLLNPSDADLSLNRGHLAKIMGDFASASRFYMESLGPGVHREAFRALSTPVMSAFALSDQKPGARSEDVVASIAGCVEHISTLSITGWILRRDINSTLFIEVDGVRTNLSPQYRSRPELMAANIDGIAFEVFTPPGLFGVEVRVGLQNASRDIAYLGHAHTGGEWLTLNQGDPNLVAVSATDLSALFASVDPDSPEFLKFGQTYAVALTSAGFQVDVLFVDGTQGSSSIRYRILNVADGLKQLGNTVCAVRFDQTDYRLVAKMNPRVVVFFRAPLNDDYKFVVDALRAKRVRIIFDIDDIAFDKSIVPEIDGVRFLTPTEFEGYLEGVEQYREFLLAADAVTAPTDFLVDYIRKTADKPVHKVINTLSTTLLTTYSGDALETPTNRASNFVIGYYSGTKTHQVDFSVCAPAIVEFLRAHADARLRIVGMFSLEEFPDLAQLTHQIEIVPMLPYYRMVGDIRNCDVVIAPLVTGNPFCEAKSELKFFESALVSRACIASPTHTFKSAMSGGEYGLLASTPEEWREQLEITYRSAEDRKALASRARDFCIAEYSFLRAGEQAHRAFFGINTLPSVNGANAIKIGASSGEKAQNLPSPSKGPSFSIGVVIPELVAGGGGHRKILRFCHDWARLGHDIHIYVDTQNHPAKVQDFIRRHYFDFPFKAHVFKGLTNPHDAYICTHWSTAYSLRNFEPKERMFYFVQDFEPMFEPVNTNFVKALGTYGLGFHIVCYGEWVARRLRREFGIDPKVIPFSLDRSAYVPATSETKSIDVLFFARPSQPRRCFELGAEALRLAFRANNSLRIGLYGERDYGEMGFAFHNFGLLTDIRELSKLYRRSRAGMCFSTTNPSLVGYEMLASGLPLIDIRLPGSDINFNGDAFVHYAEPNPDSIAAAVHEALIPGSQRDRRIQDGLNFVSTMPADDVIGEMLMDTIQATLGSALRSGKRI